VRLALQKFSYRFAEQVLNSKLALKEEIEYILTNPGIDIPSLSRPNFNETLKRLFSEKGWESESPVFDEPEDPSARMDFPKERVAV